MHYQRWRKTGDPLTTKSGKTRDEIDDPVANFWAKVIKTDSCWGWTASGQRYGKLRVSGVYVNAHRFSWELHNGPIPEGMFVLHHCDNPPCTNPEHLYLGTNSDNMVDMVRRGRRLRLADGTFAPRSD